MGAFVWNANTAGGGTSVRVFSDQIPADRAVAVDVGETICSVVVTGLAVGDKCIVSFSGDAYSSGDPSVQLFVDGAAWPTALRMNVGGTNTFVPANFVLVVQGLAAGDHTFEVRNEGPALNYMPDALPGSGASLVVTVVSAP